MGLFGSSDVQSSPQDQVDIADLKARVARLEAAVAQLQGQPGVAGSTGSTGSTGSAEAEAVWMAEVRALKDDGKLIHAIKLYRERTGVDLRTAKEYVERMG